MATERSRGPKPGAEEAVQRAIDRAAEKLQAKVAQQADKLSAKAAKLSMHLDALEVWTRDEPGRRQPRFSRAEIAAIAVEIADADGLDAVSMRRIAAELDAGTMTLYHYVRTKDELLALVLDTVMGEMVLPAGETLPGNWRDAVIIVARRSRDALRRHPWMLDITGEPPIGPNSVRHFDQTMEAVAPLDAGLSDKLDIVTAVDEYVFGFCMHERNHFHDDLATHGHVTGYINELIASGDYPQLAVLAADEGLERVWLHINEHARDPERFERNLGRLLDGLERGLARR